MRADLVPGGAAGPRPPLSAVAVSPMRRRHLRSVMRIEAQAEHRGWSVGLYLAELRREVDRLYVVARVDQRVVGFGGLLLQGPEAHVTTLAVDADVRNRRVGTRLMLVLSRCAVARGAEALTLEVRATNDPAIALYRRFGLAPAGIRKDYYADIGEDALIMWAHEIDSADHTGRLDRIEASLPDPTRLEGRLEGALP
jgi:ribosomal-protein-alanine N-acetyltransferase